MKNHLLNVDFLRENNTRMYYFGLGFIQVVLNQEERIHFYSTQLPVFNDEIHNHRYNFTSTILKGRFFDFRYQLIAGDSHILTNETCNKDIPLLNSIEIPVGVKELSEREYRAGDSYDIFFNEFHGVDTVGDTITYLKRSDIITDYAQVLFPKGVIKTCPFENTFKDDFLWDIIENTIKS